MTQTRAAVAPAQGKPVEVVTIEVPTPGPGEAVVRVQACGVCHTDLHYRAGGIHDEFPFLLGYEAAGLVEAVGTGVDDLAEGDFVVLNWRAVCGVCRACRRGWPWYCFDTPHYGIASRSGTLPQGEISVASHPAPTPLIDQLLADTESSAGQVVRVDSTRADAQAVAAGEIDVVLTTAPAAELHGLTFVTRTRTIRMLWSVFTAASDISGKELS